MGTVIWCVALMVETAFVVWGFLAKKKHGREMALVRLAGAVAIGALLFAGALQGLSRYGMLMAVLLLQAGIGIACIRGGKMEFRGGRLLAGAMGSMLLYGAALLPAFIFPSNKLPEDTGSYQVETAEYTWVDESRVENFLETGENRSLTIKFWYPTEPGVYPLVVFSHGAFGVIDSNSSTCQDLASNGYVAVSIGHTYHAMFVKDTSGNVTMADMGFVRQVYADNGADDAEGEERVFRFSREWMALRTGDENFVLDTILKKAENGEEGPFAMIDREKIGLFGHSMGGASSVQIGRERTDIGAVIDLEGTMFGEYMDFINGEYVYNGEPYPVPLLDINSRNVYEQAMALQGQGYVNFYVLDRAVNGQEIVINGAGHLNFTDLPMISPPLAKLLGTGEVDPMRCMENVNYVVRTFFDFYLKGKGELDLKKEY